MDNKDKKSRVGIKPVHTVRKGAIAANIWLRQSQTGFVYYDYSISRSWKSTNAGKEGYSQNFFPDNKMQLLQVVAEASDWIAEKMANAETVVLNAA
ncbi:hypothetical protein [Bythopirellula polymerisocia]|uniref:Uncharacterized protein n=1 Tax=Bythopirellula polymerisocia TaxID=2528003 RepID=A0A5C6CB08_9BACT|nr:hypothetical protein [Bythopirellula polymerisocia]TWU21408.1 hypothetical protein Pla144_46290 [Bythopirellula polymerisocia]